MRERERERRTIEIPGPIILLLFKNVQSSAESATWHELFGHVVSTRNLPPKTCEDRNLGFSQRLDLPAMNIFRLAGDMTHLVSVVLLLLKIYATKSCRGELFFLPSIIEISDSCSSRLICIFFRDLSEITVFERNQSMKLIGHIV